MKRWLCHHDANSLCEFMKQNVPQCAAAHFISASVFMAEGCLMFPKGTLHSTKQKRHPFGCLSVWWERVDTLRHLALPAVANGFGISRVLETRAVRIACRGAAAASTGPVGLIHTNTNQNKEPPVTLFLIRMFQRKAVSWK